MRVCVLYLCIFTLLQLQCRYVQSSEDLWLPKIEKLASILHNCEHSLSPKPKRGRSLVLSPESEIEKKIDLNTSAKSKGNAEIRSSSKVQIKSGKSKISISNSVDLGLEKGRKPQLLRKAANNSGNDQSSVSSRIGVNLNEKKSAIERSSTSPPKTHNLPTLRYKGKKSRLLEKDSSNSLARVIINKVLRPIKTRTKKAINPISISIGDNNTNHQVLATLAPEPTLPPISNVVNITNVNKVAARTKLIQKSIQVLRKKLKYADIARCVKRRLLEAYKEESSF